MIAEKEITIEEKIAQKNFPDEYSRYSYLNEIKTLSNYLFNSNGIKESLLNLISINNSGMPKLFMNENSDGPSLWKPRIREESYKELEKRKEDEIAVYFKDIGFEIHKNLQGKWFKLMEKEFIPNLKEFTAGKRVDYWYGDGASKNQMLNKFKDVKNFYQMSVNLFNEAIHAFSCFNGSINISAWNHDKHPSYEKYGHTNFGIWKGTINDFLKSASVLEETIKKIDSYRPNIYQIAKGEVKLFHQDLGLIVMRGRLRNYYSNDWRCIIAEPRELTDPATLIINNSGLREIKKEIKN